MNQEKPGKQGDPWELPRNSLGARKARSSLGARETRKARSSFGAPKKLLETPPALLLGVPWSYWDLLGAPWEQCFS